MLDVCEVIRDALEAKGFENVYLKRLGELTGREGIVVRPVSPSVSRRYADRSWSTDFIVNVMCRYRSESEAMAACYAVASAIDSAQLESANGSYKWTSTGVYTEPQELVLDEANMYVWAVQFRVVIERRER